MRAPPTNTDTPLLDTAAGASPGRRTRARTMPLDSGRGCRGGRRRGSSRARLASSVFHHRNVAGATPCSLANRSAPSPLASHADTSLPHWAALFLVRIADHHHAFATFAEERGSHRAYEEEVRRRTELVVEANELHVDARPELGNPMRRM